MSRSNPASEGTRRGERLRLHPGNPDVEPPDQVIEALRQMAWTTGRAATATCATPASPSAGGNRRGGWPRARRSVHREDVIMTNAPPAINIVLKSLLDPGDEVNSAMPYFPEYQLCSGSRRPGSDDKTTTDFQPDVSHRGGDRPRTKAVILNSPNNPTGAVYGEKTLRELNAIISRSRARDFRRALPAHHVRRVTAAGDAGRDRTVRSGVELVEGDGGCRGAHRLPGHSAHLAEAGHSAMPAHSRPDPGLRQRPGCLAAGGGAHSDVTVDVSVPGRPTCCPMPWPRSAMKHHPAQLYVFDPIADDFAFMQLQEGVLAVPARLRPAPGCRFPSPVRSENLVVGCRASSGAAAANPGTRGARDAGGHQVGEAGPGTCWPIFEETRRISAVDVRANLIVQSLCPSPAKKPS